MNKISEQTFSVRKRTNVQHEKVVINHQGIANQNHETLSQLLQWLQSKKTSEYKDWKGCEENPCVLLVKM